MTQAWNLSPLRNSLEKQVFILLGLSVNIQMYTALLCNYLHMQASRLSKLQALRSQEGVNSGKGASSVTSLPWLCGKLGHFTTNGEHNAFCRNLHKFSWLFPLQKLYSFYKGVCNVSIIPLSCYDNLAGSFWIFYAFILSHSVVY